MRRLGRPWPWPTSKVREPYASTRIIKILRRFAAKSRDELIAYLRDSFKAMKKSLGAITPKNMFDPIEGPYAGPETRLGLGSVAIWHVADHYGQLVLYMRLNRIVPPASRPKPPELKD